MKIPNDDQFKRFSISVDDFGEAKRFLAEVRHCDAESVPHEALLIAAIIYFARPFSFNEKRGGLEDIAKIKIDSFSNISSKEKALYERLIELRNKCLAHAQSSNYPTSLNKKIGVMRGRRWSILDEHIDVKKFDGLLDKLIDQVHNKRADYISASKT